MYFNKITYLQLTTIMTKSTLKRTCMYTLRCVCIQFVEQYVPLEAFDLNIRKTSLYIMKRFLYKTPAFLSLHVFLSNVIYKLLTKSSYLNLIFTYIQPVCM